MQRPITNTLACSLASVLAFGALAATMAACGAPPPKMVPVTKDDGVPANSASEERLAADGKPKPSAPPPAEDSSQPYTTPLNGGDPGASAGGPGAGGATASAGTAGGATGKGAGKGGKTPAGKEPPAPKGGGAKVSKAECRQTFEKFMDLNMSDPRLEGVPPEMLAQLKQQALQEAQTKQGDPCSTQEITRAQYTCAMGSTSSAGWQRCMK